MMHGREKSDPAIVAMKPSNEAGVPVEEMVEPRAGAMGNADQQRALRTQGRASVGQELARIRQAASSAPSSPTRGGSRMRESRTYGSVRGAVSNDRPYRDLIPDSVARRHSPLRGPTTGFCNERRSAAVRTSSITTRTRLL